MQLSTLRTGNPYDSAHMESFFETFRTRKCIWPTTRPMTMLPRVIPISSRRYIISNGDIQHWKTYSAVTYNSYSSGMFHRYIHLGCRSGNFRLNVRRTLRPSRYENCKSCTYPFLALHAYRATMSIKDGFDDEKS